MLDLPFWFDDTLGLKEGVTKARQQEAPRSATTRHKYDAAISKK